MTSHEKASNRTLMGKCFCGAVHYAVPDEFLYAMNCHCSNCRRATGSAFKPLAGIERDKQKRRREQRQGGGHPDAARC